VDKLAFNLPLNSTSLGQVSLLILRELFNKNLKINLFPIGGIDLSSQKEDPQFFNWIQESISSAVKTHKRTVPIFKLWHLNGSLESFSNKQVLLSFYEVDSPTATELNIIDNNSIVLLSSNYAISNFKQIGKENIQFLPLAFDNYNFSKINRDLKRDGIYFGLFGKLEPQRKRHVKTIQAWIKKYGNKPGYFLNCAIFNHFIDPNIQNQIIAQALGNQRYWNINFINYLQSNSLYNELLNNTDIVLGMSGGEGWGLPEFQSIALGKHGVILNAHSYKEWANEENAVLINPNGKIPVYDNLFFKQGMEYNQGNIFDWDENEFLDKLDIVEQRYKNNPVNVKGLDLQSKFSASKMVDKILEIIKNI
jgi:hypothetical protein